MTQRQDFVAVKQASFVDKYASLWQDFDDLCQRHDKQGIGKASQNLQKISQHWQDEEHYRLVALYRQICQHYALARQRSYSPVLIDNLHARVMLGHQLIYRKKIGYIGRFVWFVWYEFPCAVRTHYRLFWVGFLLFYVPCLLMGVACYLNEELIYSIMPATEVSHMETMYNPANGHIGRGSERAADTDMMMFGHYIYNNISIDFQVYALGIFLGIGTIFITLYNGIVIGAVAGHLTQAGFGETFWSFVVGHGSFELTALIISSMAGLRLGLSLLTPAPYRRKDAFVVAGKESITLLLGAALMTLIAAFIEAFWSSSTIIPNIIKYLVAIFLWIFVGWYLMFCGKQKSSDLS